MIGIIDYGRGNLRSVYKAFCFLGLEVKILKDPSECCKVTKLILPGVGAFGDGMNQLNTLGFTNPILEAVKKGIPFLGICLGMQLLFESSDENPGTQGLSLFKGKVTRFQGDYKIPHMGWNSLIFRQTPALVNGLPSNPFFYFVHSYKVEPENKEIVLSETDYYGTFVSSLHHKNITGFQFHPEKSQANGLKLLKQWSEQC